MSDSAPGFLWPRWLFLRVLGLIFLSAFYSFAFQIHGLVGERGILPAGDYLRTVANVLGPLQRFWYAPSVLWLGAGDRALTLVVGVRLVCSVLLVVNVWPGVTSRRARCSTSRVSPCCRTSRCIRRTECCSTRASSRISSRPMACVRDSVPLIRRRGSASSCCSGSDSGSTWSPASSSWRAAIATGGISPPWTSTIRLARWQQRLRSLVPTHRARLVHGHCW